MINKGGIYGFVFGAAISHWLIGQSAEAGMVTITVAAVIGALLDIGYWVSQRAKDRTP